MFNHNDVTVVCAMAIVHNGAISCSINRYLRAARDILPKMKPIVVRRVWDLDVEIPGDRPGSVKRETP